MNEIETIFYSNFMLFIKSKHIKSYISNNGIEYLYNFDSKEDYFNLNITTEDQRCINIAFTIDKQNGDYEFNGYKPDFTIGIEGLFSGYVVEIDSYQWHEKSREQSILDKKKDRNYIKLNFIPVRFSGIEVYHEPIRCIQELFEIIIEQEISRQRNDIKNLELENFILKSELEKTNAKFASKGVKNELV